jgi:glucose-6-phosphate dehydrogenase assembly protein OpcA
MITFVDSRYSGEIANRLRGVGRYHASRLIVLAYERSRRRLDARVSIASDGEPGPGQLALLRETVIVEIGACHFDDLLTIVDPLVVTDLPTLLWSPHGHPGALDTLLALAQSVLIDSIDEPICREAVQRAQELAQRAYVVDLAWLRSTPWRERIAAAFDPLALRGELRHIASLSLRHHPDSTIAAILVIGWLASRLGWETNPLLQRGQELVGSAHAHRQDVALRVQSTPELQVRGLAGLTLQTASGIELSLDRAPGGLRAHQRSKRGGEREWSMLGASRGEAGVLGEGIRQALLRDPTYVPALAAAQSLVP